MQRITRVRRPRTARARWRASSIAAVLLVTATMGVSFVAPSDASAQDGVSMLVADVDDATRPSVSQDGRWVVFEGAVDGRRSVFRTDRNSGETVELSPVPPSVRAGDTVMPRLSSDGCVVVAITEIPYDLFRDDDQLERWDVYRLVVPECGGQPAGWELVSANSSGTAIDGVFTDAPPALSGSGAIVAYVRQLAGAPEGVGTIMVVDITVPVNEVGREEEVAGMPVETPNRAYLYQGARQPVLSENGRHLAFVADTTASAPLPGWAAGPVPGEAATSQVFVWDRSTLDRRNAVHLVSGRGGVPSATGASSPSMSEAGRFIAFVSDDRTLVPADLPPCTPDCPTQVYRFDRDTDANGVFDEAPRGEPLSIVSAVDAGDIAIGVPIAGDGSSWAPTVSADGSQVAFVTDATNLLPSRRGGGGRVSDGDLLVSEMELGTVRRVLDGADLTDVPGAHGNPAMSRTGQVVVFETAAVGSLSGQATTELGARAIAAVEVTPRLSLAELDFGSTILNLESSELYVRVQNAGPASFEPTLVIVDTPFRVTGGTCAKGILVAAGTTCSVHVTFRPTAVRGYEGTLTVSGNGGNAPTVSSTVRGAAGEPILLAEPGGVDLDAGIIGGTGGRVAIDISNIAFFPTEVGRVFMAGAHPDDFVITEQSCLGRALNPGASCAVEIEFQPTDVGYRNALLVAVTGASQATAGGEYTAAFVGGYAGYEPTFDVTTDSVAVGAQLGIGLEGFPADTTVSIGFDDGSAPWAEVTTSDTGAALALLQTPTRVRAGIHRLVASAGESAIATVEIDFVAAPKRPTPGLPGFGMG
ncbi:MAG: choice-of-anchor D domain-containing protein [Ilumatobacter fluminis]